MARFTGSLSEGWSFNRALVLSLSMLVLYHCITIGLSEGWIGAGTWMETRAGWGAGAVADLPPPATLLAQTRLVIRSAGEKEVAAEEEDMEDWEGRCPCRARKQLPLLWARDSNHSDQSQPAEWEGIFREYSRLHRACTRGGDMAYVSDVYEGRKSATGDCRFLVVEFGPYGLGNRLLWLVSAFMYAVLTQRVLLIDSRDTMHDLLCEPFPGSSWKLPPKFRYSSTGRWVMPDAFYKKWDEYEGVAAEEVKLEPDLAGQDGKNGAELEEYTVEDLEREREAAELEIRAKVAGKGRTLRAVEESPASIERGRPSFRAVQANDGWSPNPRFFCQNDQRRLQEVTWLSFSGGCLYFLPNLYAVPAFRPHLEALFPDREPLRHLLRLIAYPVDHVWNRVDAVHKAQFHGAQSVVGMQVRFRDGGAMYLAMNDLVNRRMTDCALEHGAIPNNTVDDDGYNDGGRPVAIYIASLHVGLQGYLRGYYASSLEAEATGSSPLVKIIQMSHSGYQSFDLDGDFQAFAELIVLSTVNRILTSPLSTFGQVAQSYGGLRPWLVEFDPRKKNATCVAGQSVDACYQDAITELKCPSDPDPAPKLVTDLVPYLRPCQDSDGLQLVL